MAPMNVEPGTHELTEANGDLLLYTTVEGPAASLGHNLILRPEHWRATANVGASPEASSLHVSVDLQTLAVYGSRGGAGPIKPSDRKIVDKNIGKALQVAAHPRLSFVSDSITGTWEQATVKGTMTLRGRSEEQEFTITSTDGSTFTLEGTITQTRYGVTPFSTMIGAMRLGDDVKVQVSVKF